MAAPSAAEAQYRRLWKTFYDTIEIKERHNPKLRQTHMPKRYWETMTEFQDEDHFQTLEDGVDLPQIGRNIIHPHIVEQDFTGSRRDEAANDAQGGGLAAATATSKAPGPPCRRPRRPHKIFEKF